MPCDLVGVVPNARPTRVDGRASVDQDPHEARA
jgi:hypothetical protein